MNKMTIILDAMGGDNAPDEIIKGAVKAINEIEADILLVGNENVIQNKRFLRKKFNRGCFTKIKNI